MTGTSMCNKFQPSSSWFATKLVMRACGELLMNRSYLWSSISRLFMSVWVPDRGLSSVAWLQKVIVTAEGKKVGSYGDVEKCHSTYLNTLIITIIVNLTL